MNKLKTIIYYHMTLLPKDWKHRDKITHALLGTIIYLIVFYFLDRNISLAVVVFVSLVKELLDETILDGNVESYDVIATLFIPLCLYFIL